MRRSPNTISEEIRRNSVRGIYTRNRAHQKSSVRRKQSKIQCMKVAMDRDLKDYVVERLRNDQSPENISGRIATKDLHIQYASPKAIYTFAHSVHGRQIEKHLYSKAVKKKGGPKRGSGKKGLDGRILIDKRPAHVEKRLTWGHFEGDFIESGKDGSGSVLVLVERKTRFPFLAYTGDRANNCVNTLIEQELGGIPVKSITLDNDVSFQKHEELSTLINATVFFCHPYCSHEKGTVENRNKAIRRYLPKRTNLSRIPLERIKEIEQILRTRYMKCLGFRTPQEAWDEEMEQWRKKQRHGIVQTAKNRAVARSLTIKGSVLLQGSG